MENRGGSCAIYMPSCGPPESMLKERIATTPPKSLPIQKNIIFVLGSGNA
jgi:hypothetical protein